MRREDADDVGGVSTVSTAIVITSANGEGIQNWYFCGKIFAKTISVAWLTRIFNSATSDGLSHLNALRKFTIINCKKNNEFTLSTEF